MKAWFKKNWWKLLLLIFVLLAIFRPPVAVDIVKTLFQTLADIGNGLADFVVLLWQSWQ